MAFTLTANKGQNGGGASFSIGSVTAGNLIVMGLWNFSANNLTIGSISDASSGANTWNQAAGATGGGNTWIWVWSFLTQSVASDTLTVTWSTGSTNGCAFAEFTGTSVSGAVQDGVAGVEGSGTAATAPSLITTGADGLVLSYVNSNGGNPTFGTTPENWVTAVSTGNDGIAYQADVPAATYVANATFLTGTFASLLIAFKAAASGSTPSTFSVSDPTLSRIPGIH